MIREAKLNDIEQINTLGEELHVNFARLFHLETEIDNPLGIVFVYEERGSILGYLYALDFGDNIDLLSIVVQKERRSQNIGSRMMEYLIENYGKGKTITLEVSVENEAAIHLYERYHFVVEYVRKGYYNGVDGILMRRCEK